MDRPVIKTLYKLAQNLDLQLYSKLAKSANVIKVFTGFQIDFPASWEQGYDLQVVLCQKICYQVSFCQKILRFEFMRFALSLYHEFTERILGFFKNPFGYSAWSVPQGMC